MCICYSLSSSTLLLTFQRILQKPHQMQILHYKVCTKQIKLLPMSIYVYTVPMIFYEFHDDILFLQKWVVCFLVCLSSHAIIFWTSILSSSFIWLIFIAETEIDFDLFPPQIQFRLFCLLKKNVLFEFETILKYYCLFASSFFQSESFVCLFLILGSCLYFLWDQ